MMEQRKPLIAGNWKMHKTRSQSVQTAERIKKLTGAVKDIDIMIAPPFTALSDTAAVLQDSSNIALGAQNMHWLADGAYTGEISPVMLADAGCQYVIIGHSERRHLFAETNAQVNLKMASALNNKLIPILCIGETEQEREAGNTKILLDKQLQKGLQDVFLGDPKKLVIAYEPVWAIGTGKTASDKQAQEAHAFIRERLTAIFGNIAAAIRILYGGSVKPENAAELMAMPDIDGALIGGASLDADSFSRIVHYQR